MRTIAFSVILILFVVLIYTAIPVSTYVIESTETTEHEFPAAKLGRIDKSPNIDDHGRLPDEDTGSGADSAVQNSSITQDIPSSYEKDSDQFGSSIHLRITEPYPLPTPIPDGRIFTYSLPTEDAIPYIPTENPKINTRIPVMTSEPD